MGELILRDVEGWTLANESAEGELLIRDLELAERLGYERPRKIREIIERLVKEGKITGVCSRPTVGRGLFRGKTQESTTVDEYWLTEDQALLVTAKSETDAAIALTKEMIRVFMLARRGELPGQKQPRTLKGIQQATIASLGAALDEDDHEGAREMIAALGALLQAKSMAPVAAKPSTAQQNLGFAPALRVVAPQPAVPATAAPDPGAMLVAGLSKAMAELGVEEVGSTRLHTILTNDFVPPRFRLLRRAVECAFPRRFRGKFPSVKQFGRLLGTIDGLPYDGRCIARRVLDGYTLWRIDRVEAAGPALQ